MHLVGSFLCQLTENTQVKKIYMRVLVIAELPVHWQISIQIIFSMSVQWTEIKILVLLDGVLF